MNVLASQSGCVEIGGNLFWHTFRTNEQWQQNHDIAKRGTP